MDPELRGKLTEIAQREISGDDVTHDFEHARRVLANAEKIVEDEGGDLDVIIPAALFHDLVVYLKDDPDRDKSERESALKAEEILGKIDDFPEEKIERVKKCILEHPFERGTIQQTGEAKVLHDADKLEATGAISVMRTYSTTGQMSRPFYNPDDPFCEDRKPDAQAFALDLFFKRLLKVEDRIYTETARKIAKRRTEFLRNFLDEFRLELKGK